MRMVAVLIGVYVLAGPANADKPAGQPAASPVPLVDRSLLLGFLADNSSATLIDARSPAEYAEQHVAGAVNIPHDSLAEHGAQLPKDPAAPIIIYCRSGMRAGLLREQLAARGYSNVNVLPPRQLFWTDEVMVFNCGVTPESDGPSVTAAAPDAGDPGVVSQ